MARKALLGAQVKCLLSDVSDHCSRHLNEVETDLVQTSILLREAIEKLGACFMAIHEAVEMQQQMDSIADIAANSGVRQLDAGLENATSEPRQRLLSGVGVDS